MTECPQCSGPVWDNRAKKQRGEMKAAGPDFACKDKDGCGWLQWPEKPKPAPKAAGPGLPVERGPKHTWASLSDTYQRSMLIARKSVLATGTAMKLEVTMADLLAATHTIFITAARDGVRAPAPEPEPEDAAV